METTINQRIKKIISYYKLSQSDFARKAGLTRSNVSNIINNKHILAYDKIVNILSSWPEISAEWLMMGRGTMTRPLNEDVEKNEFIKPVHIGEIISVQRVKIGMTKAELARRLDCSPQNIDRIESSKNIDIDKALQIGKILEFDIFSNFSSKMKSDIELIQAKYIGILEENRELRTKLALK